MRICRDRCGSFHSPHPTIRLVQATRRLTERFDAWRRGDISFGAFDASVQGWSNHLRYADTSGLRRHVLKPFAW